MFGIFVETDRTIYLVQGDFVTRSDAMACLHANSLLEVFVKKTCGDDSDVFIGEESEIPDYEDLT